MRVLGAPNAEAADVKLDSVANMNTLQALLQGKYAIPPSHLDKIQWQNALDGITGGVAPVYKASSYGNDYATYLLTWLKNPLYLKKGEIFVAYLVDPNPTSNVADASHMNKYIANGELGNIADFSAIGKFVFHPGYHLA